MADRVALVPVKALVSFEFASLTPQARHVWLVLLAYANNDGVTTLSGQALRRKCHASGTSTVRRSLDLLVARGWVGRLPLVRDHRGVQAASYRVTAPPLSEVDDA